MLVGKLGPFEKLFVFSKEARGTAFTFYVHTQKESDIFAFEYEDKSPRYYKTSSSYLNDSIDGLDFVVKIHPII